MCYKYGALWGYFERGTVAVTTAEDTRLDVYRRDDEGSDGDIGFNRCGHCGTMMFWAGLGEFAGPEQEMGVNCRMLTEAEIDGIPRSIEYGP